MRAEVFALAASTIAAWGLFGLFGKLAVVYMVASGQLVPINLHASGITFGLLAGLGGCVGTILFYQLLAREPASLVVPMTSLYPAVTVVLSVAFLHEELAATRIVGIIFALAAVFLLTR